MYYKAFVAGICYQDTNEKVRGRHWNFLVFLDAVIVIGSKSLYFLMNTNMFESHSSQLTVTCRTLMLVHLIVSPWNVKNVCGMGRASIQLCHMPCLVFHNGVLRYSRHGHILPNMTRSLSHSLTKVSSHSLTNLKVIVSKVNLCQVFSAMV